MTTLAEVKTAAETQFTPTEYALYGAWMLKVGTVGQTGSIEYGKLALLKDNGDDTYTPIVLAVVVKDRGLGTEEAFCSIPTPTAAQQWYAAFRAAIKNAIKNAFPATYCHVGTIEWGDPGVGVPSCVANVVKTSGFLETRLVAYFDEAYPSEHLAIEETG